MDMEVIRAWAARVWSPSWKARDRRLPVQTSEKVPPGSAITISPSPTAGARCGLGAAMAQVGPSSGAPGAGRTIVIHCRAARPDRLVRRGSCGPAWTRRSHGAVRKPGRHHREPARRLRPQPCQENRRSAHVPITGCLRTGEPLPRMPAGGRWAMPWGAGGFLDLAHPARFGKSASGHGPATAPGGAITTTPDDPVTAEGSGADIRALVPCLHSRAVYAVPTFAAAHQASGMAEKVSLEGWLLASRPVLAARTRQHLCFGALWIETR